MSSLNKAFLIETTGNIMTPKGRCLYPDVFKATQVKGQGKFKYRITLLIPKGADISVLEKEIADASADFVKAKIKWDNPLHKTKDEPKLAELADEFPYFIRANADNRPQVVGPSLKIINEDAGADEVYGGRHARISVGVYSYKDKPGNGVGLGLSNVQFLDHDEPLGGGRVAASAEFEAVDDSDMAGMEA